MGGQHPTGDPQAMPYEELGRSAVRLALEGEAPGEDHVELSTRLVIRQSVRRLK